MKRRLGPGKRRRDLNGLRPCFGMKSHIVHD